MGWYRIKFRLHIILVPVRAGLIGRCSQVLIAINLFVCRLHYVVNI